MKIVINRCFGGFGLSEQANRLYAEAKGIPVKEVYEWEIERDDPDLVRIVGELGEDADGPFASLRVVDIPDDVEWFIHEYDGLEKIHEKHRSWT